MGRLTAFAVRAVLSNPGIRDDNDGFLLKAEKRGVAAWLLRIRRNGNRPDIPGIACEVRNQVCAVLDYAHVIGWRSAEAPSGRGERLFESSRYLISIVISGKF